jgi:hypothetical protein
VTPSTSSKRIYVAGASAQIELIECMLAKLIEAGWVITCDWCAAVRAAGNVASPDDPQVRREAALADLEGVATADVFWLVQPDSTSTSTGSWVELGFALALRVNVPMAHVLGGNEGIRHVLAGERPGLPRIVVSGASRKCIFADLCDYRFREHDDALDFIKRGLVGINDVVASNFDDIDI